MSDDELIKRCQNGDTSAFEALLERHYDSIYRIAYQWCRNKANAQDITQQVCLKLAKSLNSFKFNAAFSSWLYSVVINSARDFYKSPTQSNIRETNLNSVDERNHVQADTTRLVYTQQLLSHINKLKDELKDALILVYVDGLNHQQAAKKLGVKEGTVSWRIHQARKHLKHTFDSSQYDSTVKGDTL